MDGTLGYRMADYVQPCRRCGSPVTHWRGNPAGRAFEPDPYEPYRPHLCARATDSAPAFVPEFVPAVVLRLLLPNKPPERPEPAPAVSRGAVARGLVRMGQVGPYARPQGETPRPAATPAPPVRRTAEPGFDL